MSDEADGRAGAGGGEGPPAGGDERPRAGVEERPGAGDGPHGEWDDPPPDHGSPLDLALAWREHRRHVGAAAGVFAAGLVLGVLLYAAGVDLLAALGIESLEDIVPEDFQFTAVDVFLNNARVYGIVLLGAITLGLGSAGVLAFNGVLVGWVVGDAAAGIGIGPVLALLLPHGIFELPALWIAGGVAFRLVHLLANYLRGARDRLLSRAELGRLGLLLLTGIALLAVAAVIEVHVTEALADAVFDLPGESAGP